MKVVKRKARNPQRSASKRKPKSRCPIYFALDIFGDAWSLLIVRDLMFKQKSSYRDLVDGGEGISTNILADRLARLEADGIITKEVIHTAVARTQYKLTEKGFDLMPMLLEMIAWSARYDPKTAAPNDFVKRVLTDRDGLVTELRANFAK